MCKWFFVMFVRYAESTNCGNLPPNLNKEDFFPFGKWKKWSFASLLGCRSSPLLGSPLASPSSCPAFMLFFPPVSRKRSLEEPGLSRATLLQGWLLLEGTHKKKNQQSVWKQTSKEKCEDPEWLQCWRSKVLTWKDGVDRGSLVAPRLCFAWIFPPLRPGGRGAAGRATGGGGDHVLSGRVWPLLCSGQVSPLILFMALLLSAHCSLPCNRA